MDNFLVFKTDTTGLPDWGSPSDSDNQPHIVRISAIVFDGHGATPSSTIDLIIRPDGWDIPQVTVKLHGVSGDYAASVGVSEQTAIELFYDMAKERKIVTFNAGFEWRIIRIAAKRYLPEKIADEMKIMDVISVKKMAHDFCGKTISLVDASNEILGFGVIYPDTFGSMMATQQIYSRLTS